MALMGIPSQHASTLWNPEYIYILMDISLSRAGVAFCITEKQACVEAELDSRAGQAGLPQSVRFPFNDHGSP